MAVTRTGKNNNKSKDTEFLEKMPKFEKRWFSKIIEHVKKNPSVKTVELNYSLCWGYGNREDFQTNILKSQINIQYIRSFIDRVNQYFSESNTAATCTIMVNLYPNEKEPEKVLECDNLATQLLEDLRKNSQLRNIKSWRENNEWLAANESFQKYYENKVRKDNLIKGSQQKDVPLFLKKHPTFTQDECIKHYMTETVDLLALMSPTDDNTFANEKKISNQDTFRVLFSEHELCDMMYTVLDNANIGHIGYKKDSLTTFVVSPEIAKKAIENNHTGSINTTTTMNTDPTAQLSNSTAFMHQKMHQKRKNPSSNASPVASTKQPGALPPASNPIPISRPNNNPSPLNTSSEFTSSSSGSSAESSPLASGQDSGENSPNTQRSLLFFKELVIQLHGVGAPPEHIGEASAAFVKKSFRRPGIKQSS